MGPCHLWPLPSIKGLMTNTRHLANAFSVASVSLSQVGGRVGMSQVVEAGETLIPPEEELITVLTAVMDFCLVIV